MRTPALEVAPPPSSASGCAAGAAGGYRNRQIIRPTLRNETTKIQYHLRKTCFYFELVSLISMRFTVQYLAHFLMNSKASFLPDGLNPTFHDKKKLGKLGKSHLASGWKWLDGRKLTKKKRRKDELPPQPLKKDENQRNKEAKENKPSSYW